MSRLLVMIGSSRSNLGSGPQPVRVPNSLAGLVAGEELVRVFERALAGVLRVFTRVLADPLLVELVPSAVLERLFDRLTQELGGLGFALRDADSVRLGRQRVTDELQAVVLDDHPRKDDVVGRDRVDGTVLDLLEALRVRVDEIELGVGSLLGQRPLVGRAKCRTNPGALTQVVDSGDVRPLWHQDATLRDVVGPAEIDLRVSVRRDA